MEPLSGHSSAVVGIALLRPWLSAGKENNETPDKIIPEVSQIVHRMR